MNDATKRISRKSSSQSTSLRAGTSGQAVKQAIQKSMSGNVNPAGNTEQSNLRETQSAPSGSDGALSDGERRALFSNISQNRPKAE
ncbi:MAG TPA: hypothetical protein PKD52_00050 [Clostridiales bacterium]|nr:hypothetical protein [Clostridiales bacterium]